VAAAGAGESGRNPSEKIAVSSQLLNQEHLVAARRLRQVFVVDFLF